VRIPSEEVSFHPHSHGDPAGRLFRWNGQLYRGIRAEWKPVWTALFDKCVIERMVGRGLLIDTEPTDLTLEGFDLVVRHRGVPFPSYPEEWCAAMFRDGGVAILDLLIELAPYGVSLKDGHLWNVLFDGGRFVYVDLTSLTPLAADGGWPGYNSFRRFCLHPLLLMAHGQERIARRLLPEPEGVTASDVRLLARSGPLSSAAWLVREALEPSMARLHRSTDPVRSTVRRLERVRRRLDDLPIPRCRPGDLADHAEPAPPAGRTVQQDEVQNLLARLRPESVLVVGREAAWWSRLAGTPGRRVVSFDTDAPRVTRLYCEVRAGALPILPLLMDFADPTPARGLSGHWTIAATERLPCDLVIALDLVHHMVFRRLLDFAHIAGGLRLFAKRWLVVEFAPAAEPEAGGSVGGRFAWYTLEDFVAALERHFRAVTVLPRSGPSRALLLCER
jgi:hypothetical protein